MNEKEIMDEIEIGSRAGYHFQLGWEDTLFEYNCFFHGFEHLGWYVCTECGHCYQTPEELIVKYNEQGSSATEEPNRWVFKDLDQIYFCPECLHDF